MGLVTADALDFAVAVTAISIIPNTASADVSATIFTAAFSNTAIAINEAAFAAAAVPAAVPGAATVFEVPNMTAIFALLTVTLMLGPTSVEDREEWQVFVMCGAPESICQFPLNRPFSGSKYVVSATWQ